MLSRLASLSKVEFEAAQRLVRNDRRVWDAMDAVDHRAMRQAVRRMRDGLAAQKPFG